MSLSTISVVIPSYRRGERIRKTLDSVLQQARLPDEMILVNDGGFPETREVIAAEYPTVQVIDVEHGGAALARNRGAEAARGDWILFFDDDDIMLPQAIETLDALRQRFPEAKAIHADHELKHLTTGSHWKNHHVEQQPFQRISKVTPVRSEGKARLYDWRLFRAMLQGNLLQQPWLVERETFRNIGGFFSIKASDDWDLFLRITRQFPVVLSDEVISTHIVEKDRPHMSLAPGQMDSEKIVIRRVLKATPIYELSTRLILWRRLAIFHKSDGDKIRSESLPKAWLDYLQSFLLYPFDLVVGVRLLVWPLKMFWPWKSR